MFTFYKSPTPGALHAVRFVYGSFEIHHPDEHKDSIKKRLHANSGSYNDPISFKKSAR